MSRRYLCGALVGVLATAGALATSAAARPSHSQGQAKRSIMRPLGFKSVKHAKPARPRRTNNLSYRGGVGGIGVETAPKVYLVLWGSQWSNDPSGEATILQSFFNHAGGSHWLNSVTQYCQGVAAGTITCGTSGQHAGNPSAIYGGIFTDSTSTAPSSPTQSQLAAEAVKAAANFNNKTAGSNASVQYVIATSHGHNASGFGTSY